MIEYKIVPTGSENWIPRDWEIFYKQFKQKTNEIPTVLGKMLHKGLEYARGVIVKEYLTGPRPDRLGVVTGRLRASINYRIVLENKERIEGIIGTNVWYGRLHEFGETTKDGRDYPKRPFLGPGLEQSDAYFKELFAEAGLTLQVI